MPIVPDDKDWTWVLERRCPECGFEATAVPPESIGSLVRANASEWVALLGRPGCELRRRPTEDRWSPLEYACHVRDVFALYDVRLRLMLEEDDPLYANWDQDATAVEQRYGEQDPVLVADQLRAAAQLVVGPAEDGNPGRRVGPELRADGVGREGSRIEPALGAGPLEDPRPVLVVRDDRHVQCSGAWCSQATRSGGPRVATRSW